MVIVAGGGGGDIEGGASSKMAFAAVKAPSAMLRSWHLLISVMLGNIYMGLSLEDAYPTPTGSF